jgi:hypothetical protein
MQSHVATRNARLLFVLSKGTNTQSRKHTDSPDLQVYLAMEEKEAGSMTKAKLLMTEFAKCFLAIKSSIHPYAIPGEAAGKSSNVAFAARRVFANHQHDSQDVIITIMDGM